MAAGSRLYLLGASLRVCIHEPRKQGSRTATLASLQALDIISEPYLLRALSISHFFLSQRTTCTLRSVALSSLPMAARTPPLPTRTPWKSNPSIFVELPDSPRVCPRRPARGDWWRHWLWRGQGAAFLTMSGRRDSAPCGQISTGSPRDSSVAVSNNDVLAPFRVPARKTADLSCVLSANDGDRR